MRGRAVFLIVGNGSDGELFRVGFERRSTITHRQALLQPLIFQPTSGYLVRHPTHRLAPSEEYC